MSNEYGDPGAAWDAISPPNPHACAECGGPALDPAKDTLGDAPICAKCLNDYLADAGTDYRVPEE